MIDWHAAGRDELVDQLASSSSLFSGVNFIITSIRTNDPNFGGSCGREGLVATINRHGGKVMERVEECMNEREDVKVSHASKLRSLATDFLSFLRRFSNAGFNLVLGSLSDLQVPRRAGCWHTSRGHPMDCRLRELVPGGGVKMTSDDAGDREATARSSLVHA